MEENLQNSVATWKHPIRAVYKHESHNQTEQFLVRIVLISLQVQSE